MEGERGFKRKKRKSILQQARRYGNKGCYGRGSDLPEDVYQYLVRVLELSRGTFETTEDKEVFVNNSFSQMEGEEIKYSCHQLGSRIVETLLPWVNDDIFTKFLLAFSDDLRPMCLDRFASHVLQKLISTAAERSSKFASGGADVAEKHLQYNAWVLKTCKFVLNNFEEFIWDQYANHVFRTALECLGGFSQGETTGRSKKWGPAPLLTKITSESEVISTKKEIPAEFKLVLKESAKQIIAWSQFSELPYNDLTSGVLQTLLYVICTVSKTVCSDLIRKLLDECFTYVHIEFAYDRDDQDDCDEKEKKKFHSKETTTLDVFYSETASRVLDAAISVATPKRFTQIYARCFINNLGKLAQMPIANYQVQRLFQHCSDKTEFEAMYEEIAVSLEAIFQNKTTGMGVIVSLGQACKRLSAKQAFFFQEIMKLLHCNEPEDRQIYVAPLMAKLITYEEREENLNNKTVNIHGSVLLQTLLLCSKPIKVVNSLLAMSGEELNVLFCDPKGSHVMDVFMTSESIGEKSREKMLRKLQGSLVSMACSKHGSRSLDAMWGVMNMKQRMQAMEELSAREAILNSNTFGKIIAFNYKIPLFKYRPDDWKEDQGKTNRKRKLFQDIIGDIDKKTK